MKYISLFMFFFSTFSPASCYTPIEATARAKDPRTEPGRETPDEREKTMSDEIRTNPVTGAKYIAVERRGTFSPNEITLRHPVDGLKAFETDRSIMRFEWKSADLVDEADARDAQCRAGWNDNGYGFFAFHFESGLATWSCARSCD